MCILQDWLWTVAKGLRALQVKDSRGEEGLWRGCTKLTCCLICYVLSSYEIILLYVSKVSLLSFTMDERIKGLKKLYSVLGNLTNSVCISVPAAPFIVFFGWLGGWRDRSSFNPFYTPLYFPFSNTSSKKKKKEQWLWFFYSLIICLGPISILEMKCTTLSHCTFHPDKNLEMEACTVPSFVLGQEFPCSLVNIWCLLCCCFGYS